MNGEWKVFWISTMRAFNQDSDLSRFGRREERGGLGMTRSGNIEKSKWIGVGLREGGTEDERKESILTTRLNGERIYSCKRGGGDYGQ